MCTLGSGIGLVVWDGMACGSNGKCHLWFSRDVWARDLAKFWRAASCLSPKFCRVFLFVSASVSASVARIAVSCTVTVGGLVAWGKMWTVLVILSELVLEQ